MKFYNILAGAAGAINKVYRTVVPAQYQKELRRATSLAQKIDGLRSEFMSYTDAELADHTTTFKQQLANGKTLDDILPRAFAVVREVSRRIRGEEHYISQLIGGIVLHKGMIAEMGTGEGKTLLATLPAYLNALTGKGVHIITVNDYLATLGAQNMGQIFKFLGLTVGCLATGTSGSAAYACDITYGTNHDFVFDYLRDNLATSTEQVVQRPFHFCIIDEVDNILIDEARTPCIISGQANDASDLCSYADYVISTLDPSCYEIDEKAKGAHFTEKGLHTLDQLFHEQNVIEEGKTIFDQEFSLLVHHLQQALKAHTVYRLGIEYIVKDGEVIIIDSSTGRMMDGRRFSDGLHQAIEAKENVEILQENQTLATITYQKFFSLYPTVSGMTGTAMTEEEELSAIYNLAVVPIPPNKPSKRIVLDDKIYMSFQEKLEGVVAIIEQCLLKKQPVLLGTSSVEQSEKFAHALSEHNIPHKVLNAKNHALEADIIAQAGVPGTITIATNMAGRGTDIKLGGTLKNALRFIDNPTPEQIAAAQDHIHTLAEEARQAGGLMVIGTERAESRRIDNQLLGRCGRQGDPGTALFVISLEDTIMRLSNANLQTWLKGSKYGEVLEHPMLSKAVNRAQKKLEQYHFDIRKDVLKYDSVVNEQSAVVYEQRRQYLYATNIVESLIDIAQQHLDTLLIEHSTDAAQLRQAYQTSFGIDVGLDVNSDVLHDRLAQAITDKQQELKESFDHIVREICLHNLDTLFRQHLTAMENIRTAIGLKSYAQQDPLNEFKREAFSKFSQMVREFRNLVCQQVFSDTIDPTLH